MSASDARLQDDLHTTAVHAGRASVHALGKHAPPIDLSSTYPFDDMDAAARSLTNLAHGAATAENPIYARLHNPTVARAEQAVAALEGATDTVAYASGMAAVTAVLMATRTLRDDNATPHVVAVRPIYGTTDHLLTSTLLGIDVSWAAPDAIAEAVRPATALVMIETPANPTLDLVDIQAVADQAGDVPVVVDSTFAPPVIQRPLEHGATLSLHSATKFLGGHGDVMGGVVSTSDADWAAALRHVRVATGALLHPHAAYLMHRSMPTLPARVERAQSTATALADRLQAHPAVQAVHFPGYDAAACYTQQMDGPGTLISFELGTYEAARAAVETVSLITAAVSLGSTDTLIQHPASLTHGVVDDDAKSDHGITPGLVRLSVGLESADALWADLEQALEACAVGV